MSALLSLSLLSADLHADGYAINVAPKDAQVCVVIPRERRDDACKGLALDERETGETVGRAIVRKAEWQYRVTLDRLETKGIGATSAEDLAQQGSYTVVSIAGSPAARFETATGVRFQVPSDDHALVFEFSGGRERAAAVRSEGDSMVRSIVRPRADLTLYGKPRAEQAVFRERYAAAFRRTQMLVRLATFIAVVGIVILSARVWKQRRRPERG